ncbi:hypothetical protein IH824_08765 [candidate division KSB1 bacterium]|nr:hypothetical protein [candidate division KSB1 bacterium]
MNGKWRKNTAVFLACVFFVLSFSVEFAHQHGYSQASLLIRHECECEIYADEKNSIQNGSNVCFSCVYSKIPVVLNTSFQPSQSLDTNQTLQAIEELVLPSQTGSLFNTRAPPQAIS